jgi:hypothetical protein
MPRLSHPLLTKGEAIVCLLNLYWNEPSFKQELNSLRQPYVETLTKFAKDSLDFWLAVRQALPPDKYRETRHHMYCEWALEGGELPPLPSHLVHRLKKNEELWQELQPYGAGLEDLAWKWKLRAGWSILALVWYDIWTITLETSKLPKEVKEVDAPLDSFDDLYPWEPPPLPPLEIRVSSWAFFHLGRQQMMKQMARELQEYEGKIRYSLGQERPSGMERHAHWWFEHYVHRKSYDEIAQKEAYTPGGLLNSYAKNVGAAVRRFSRLLGIDRNILK